MDRIRFLPADHAASLSPEQCIAALIRLLEQGETALSLPCPAAEGTVPYRFLRAIADFLLDHPAIRQIELLCRAEDLPAYRFQWNMWFAERRHD